MDQSVMSFADSTARATSIGTANFEEGMLSYLQDTNQLEVYDGAAWSQIGQTPGLVKLNTTSFSGVSSVSLAVASFSASYRSYKLIINQTASTSNVELYYRMRVSGADNSTSNYYGSGFQSIFNGSSGVDFTDNATSAGTLGEVSVDGALFEIHLMNPFETQKSQFFTLNNTANGGKTIFAGGFFNLTTSFDAISFYPTSGTITGRYQLFGVNE
jgi:hypothetical protein